MTPRPSLQKQFVSQSAKVFTSQERPSLQTTERRRSVVSPERQAPNVAKYELVAYNDQSEDEDVLESVQEPTKAIHFLPPRWFIFAVGLVIGLSIATGGFTLDRWLSTGAKYSHTDSKGLLTVLAPPGHILRTFAPNETFKLGVDGSNDAWRSILPEGLGFVQHPSLGPEIVGLAFVHQLHCLDKLRQALTVTHKEDLTPRHLSHCVEYLRHSIMCNADANLEYRKVDPASDRVETPGDDVHLCRGFGELFHFSEKWRVYDGKTVSQKRRIKDDELGRTIHYDYVSSRGDMLPHD